MRSFEPFRLDVANQRLWRGERQVPLMPKPFAVLRYLVEHPGRLVTHEELLEAVWPDTYVQPEVLRRYILEIRRALGDRAEAPQFVRTFPKRGYQFVAPVVDDSGPVAVAAAPSAAKLVGRDDALRNLNQSLTVARQGRREIVFIVGEPGIGKTSLVDAFDRACAATEGVVVARGQSVEGFGGKEPYYPLLEALGQLARGPSRAFVVDILARNAPTWFIQLPSLIRQDQQAELLKKIAGANRERMVRELCEALEIMTQTMTLVLILEDLHWVDRSTVDALSAIARRREPAKLLVIGTCRPADLIISESPLKALKHDLVLHRLSRELELEPLHETDVADYISAEYAPGDLPPSLAQLIYRHSEGNPLFMTAMLDHLVNRGVLSSRQGRWTMSVPDDEVDPGVPDTLRQMLEIQLQHATDEEQQVLKCASVAGQHFSSWSVTTMLGGEPSTYEEICDALAERQQFLRHSGTRELSDGSSSAEYQFRHALYRDVLYRRLPPAQRSDFHRRLAAGLEGLRADDREMAAEIAVHFEEGHDYERAIRHLLIAASNATRRYVYRDAIVVLEHAINLLARVPEGRRDQLELQLLEKIGNAHYALRDMKQAASTYETIATRAAQAGLLEAQADALMRVAHPAESIPFYLRAIELDPNLVAAYTTLSRIYSNLGETGPAREFAKQAYERRHLVGERDQLSIAYQYHFEMTGNQSRATEVLESWKRRFPSEFQPVNSLTLIHNFLGRFEAAVESGREAVKLNPRHGYPYSNLAHAYRGLGRFDDARQTAERAVALEIETLPTRRLLYQIAILDGDDQAAARHAEWARDKPREFDMIGARAQAAAWAGRAQEARALYETASTMADRRNLHDVGTSHLAWATAMELAHGTLDRAVQLARSVLERSAGYDSQLRAALVLALSGGGDEAQSITDELVAANPEHTMINEVLAPIVRAGVELGRNEPELAIEHLSVVAPYELGFIAALIPVHLRAHAYLALKAGAHAAAEFQRLLDRRGSDPFSPFHGVALLGLARAHAMAGDLAASVEAYERFLTNWRDADSDLPVLNEARNEYRRLTAPAR